VTSGAWRGEHLVFTYQWERCAPAGTGCAPVLGGTSQGQVPFDAYALTQADVGSRIEVTVTATNPAGSAEATSNESGPVLAAGPPVAAGRLERFDVFSPAVGRAQPVYVYLPPEYDPARRPRYPVLYLLHGYPGGPGSFVGGVPAGPTEDRLLARGLVPPTILVMPQGAPNPLTETSWVDGVGPHAAWETFLARDVVGWVDRTFDADRAARGRAIAGISDGGYGALDIALHHPHEFAVVESWSGYEHADPTETAVYGTSARLLAEDSPAVILARTAPVLRRAGVVFWLSVGWQDGLRFENAQFASRLVTARVPHRFVLLPGSHLPSVYRAELPAALVAASRPDVVATAAGARGPALGFAIAQQGAPDGPAAAGVVGMQASGGGVVTLRRALSPRAVQEGLPVSGSIRLTLEPARGGPLQLRLRLGAGAVAAAEAGKQTATLLALPARVVSSSDGACPVGAGGFVDLETADDATGTTHFLVVDLRPRCPYDLGFDDAPWRDLPAGAFRLRLGR